MELLILRMLRGYVRIRIIGNSYDRFLNLCAYHGIELWNLCPAEESYEANISNKDFRKLKTIIRKSHIRIRITERHGLPFFMFRNRKRKMWPAAVLAAGLFMFWLSSHIWLITIEGNVSQTDDVLFEYLDEIGIVHGMKKADVDCRQLAADIRNYFTDFTWVSAKLQGTRLDIAVKEGIIQEKNGTEQSDKEPRSEGEGSDDSLADLPSDLVAAEAGTIVSIYVRRGLAQVEAGTEVEAGTVLVSGTLPVYDDSGSVKNWQYVSSDADIVIRTTVDYEDKVSFVTEEKTYTGNEKKGWMIRIGDIPLGIGSIRHSYESWDFLRKITQARLFENFYLPLYAERLSVKEYKYEQKIRTKEEAEAKAEENFQAFLENLTEKGVQIFENNVRIEWYEKFCTVSGTVVIGKEAVQRAAVQKKSQEELQANEYG